MKVIDISYYQGNIDFAKVKKDGIEGVIIRAGYGKGNIDKKFSDYMEKAVAAGLHIGIYWFSYAYSVSMAKNEAKMCLSIIDGYKDKIDLPVFFDWEYDSMNYAGRYGVNPGKSLITNMNLEFCKLIKAAGYKAGYYANPDYLSRYINQNKLKDYYFWLAHYTSKNDVECDIWQYSDKGKVNGINGSVDMDQCYIELGKIKSNNESDKSDTEVYDMPTIKKGSKGKAVKIWQVIIGADIDGDFGKDTLAKTKEFQKAHNLTVDGIVGAKTWKAGLDSV